jgi:hypothetical protein
MQNNNTTTTVNTTDVVGNTPTTTIITEQAPAITTLFDRATFIEQFNTNGSPKQRKVPCTVTGKMITIFGANLKSRIAKYGSVEAFLDGFVSRKASSKQHKQQTAQ